MTTFPCSLRVARDYYRDLREEITRARIHAKKDIQDTRQNLASVKRIKKLIKKYYQLDSAHPDIPELEGLLQHYADEEDLRRDLANAELVLRLSNDMYPRVTKEHDRYAKRLKLRRRWWDWQRRHLGGVSTVSRPDRGYDRFDIYYGGESTPDGTGHGHIILSGEAKVEFWRPPGVR